MAIVWILLLAEAFADPCQRLLPWSDSPNALKMFVSGVSNRTDKTTAYASHYMHIMYTHHYALKW